MKKIPNKKLQLIKKIKSKIKRHLLETAKKVLQVPIYLFKIGKAAITNALIMIPVVYAVQWYMQYLGVNMTPSVVPDSPFNYMTKQEVVITMVAVGIFEEVYFRYLVMDCMFQKWLKWTPKFSWVLSSLMFGYAHMANLGYPYSLPQVIGAIGAGLWFGHLYEKKGLHFAIFTHAAYNAGVTIIPTLFT